MKFLLASDGDRFVILDERWRVSLPLRRESFEFERCFERLRDEAVGNKWSERCRRWSPDDGRDDDGGRCCNERGE